MTQLRKTLFVIAIFCVSLQHVRAENSILVQSTTSTANSGLYGFLLPIFEAESGVKVNVVAVGTGQAIRNASNCDADVLLVHATSAEKEFVRQGHGVRRYDLMYNDFVIVGPLSDPAAISQSASVSEALNKIAASKNMFASRGDNSGTHKKELALWQRAQLDPTADSGRWYRETGSGMGATLNASIGMQAYTLTDRATWISFNNKQQHVILLEGEDSLFNQYGVILVSQQHCPNANSAAGQQFIDWLISNEGQKLIASFQVDNQQLFYPNAIAE